MLSNIKGNNYVILPDDKRFPVTINKKKTDASIAKLSKAMKSVNDALKELYDTDTDLYYILRDQVLESAGVSVSDQKVWELGYAADELDRFLTDLQNNHDEIPKEEDITTLEDIGYKCDMTDSRLYEMRISDDGTTEVTDEIYLDKAGCIRRQRTIVWKPTDGGRTSDKITYKALPISQKLKKIIENTRREKYYG